MGFAPFCVLLTAEAYFALTQPVLVLCYKYTGVADGVFRLAHFEPSTATADRKAWRASLICTSCVEKFET